MFILRMMLFCAVFGLIWDFIICPKKAHEEKMKQYEHLWQFGEKKENEENREKKEDRKNREKKEGRGKKENKGKK